MDAAERPIRLLLSGRLAFGPGKAELLGKIAALGSLSAAASAMDMSYMKAWKMVRSLNDSFREPLVALHRGGKEQGGASLSPLGIQVLDLYHKAVAIAETATAETLGDMRALLREPLPVQ